MDRPEDGDAPLTCTALLSLLPGQRPGQRDVTAAQRAVLGGELTLISRGGALPGPRGGSSLQSRGEDGVLQSGATLQPRLPVWHTTLLNGKAARRLLFGQGGAANN
jgi:hypothetical protein